MPDNFAAVYERLFLCPTPIQLSSDVLGFARFAFEMMVMTFALRVIVSAVMLCLFSRAFVDAADGEPIAQSQAPTIGHRLQSRISCIANHSTTISISTISVENLFNTNSYNFLQAPNLGVPAIADFAQNGTIRQGSYSTYLIPAVTRTMRVSLRAHVGR